MKNDLNILLCESIINTDFLLVNKKKKKNLKFQESFCLSLGPKKSLVFLDLFILVKELKQCIMILMFLELRKINRLFLYLRNLSLYEIAEEYLAEYKMPIKCFLLKVLNNSFSARRLQVNVVFGISFFNIAEIMPLIKSLKILLSCIVRLDFETIGDDVHYTLKNSIDNYPKLLFLLSMIDIVLNKLTDIE